MVSAAQSIGCVLQRLGCDCRICAAAGRETSAGGERARSDDLEDTFCECRARDGALQCSATNATTGTAGRLDEPEPASANSQRWRGSLFPRLGVANGGMPLLLLLGSGFRGVLLHCVEQLVEGI